MDGLPAVVICNGRTKKGERCARPVGENGVQCWRHAPETAELARTASKAGAEKRNRTVTELLREKVDADPELLLGPLVRALTATKSYEQNGKTVVIADNATQLKAFEIAHDRLYGRPMQTTEITSKDGGPLLALLKIAAEEQRGLSHGDD
jgi:hypothetical protein